MKTLYGVQLGNYLRHKSSGRILKVNGITKRKIGSAECNKEVYHYLHEIEEVPLSLEILEKYKEYLDDYNEISGSFCIVPKNSFNLHNIKWFHELQNVLGLYNYKIE